MSLEEIIGQMTIPAIRFWSGEKCMDWSDASKPGYDGFTASPEQLDIIRKAAPGGLTLFAINIDKAEQTKALTDSLQQAASDAPHGIGLFMTIDQEGGLVTRLTTGTTMPGNMALAASGDPENARIAAAVFGEELEALGINTNFGPVADVNNNPLNPVIGLRSFSSDPKIVSAFASSYADGLHEHGILSSFKHFPGHGNAGEDSHTGLPLVDISPEDFYSVELFPYAENISKADMIMTAHIQFPQIEKNTYRSISTGEQVYIPATLSKTILTDILRGELGFDGLIVTDSFEMGALKEHFDYRESAVMAINAGADMITIPVDLTCTANIRQYEELIQTLADAVRSGEIPQERVDASVLRILKMKEKYGLLDARALADRETDLTIVGSPAHHQTEFELAKKTVTVVKGAENLPLKLNEGSRVTVLANKESYGNSVLYARDLLEKEGRLPEGVSLTFIDPADQPDLDRIVGDSDILICASSFSGAEIAAALEGRSERLLFIRELIRTVHENGKMIILLSQSLPYDAAFFTDADVMVLTYLPVGMKQIPDGTAGGVQKYGPNMPAAIYLLLGGEVPQGVLPVDIPAVDENDRLTGEILYPHSPIR